METDKLLKRAIIAINNQRRDDRASGYRDENGDYVEGKQDKINDFGKNLKVMLLPTGHGQEIVSGPNLGTWKDGL
jgi:hypothetical protein